MSAANDISVLPQAIDPQEEAELTAAMETVMNLHDVPEDSEDVDGEETVEQEATKQEAQEKVEPPAKAEAKPTEEPGERSVYSKKLADIAKLEWEATQEKKALKEAQAAAKSELEKAAKLNAKYDRLREVAKTDKFAALQHLGIDPRDIVQDILQAGGLPKATVDLDAEVAAPEPKAEPTNAKIQELEARLAKFEQAQQASAGEKAIADFKQEVARVTTELLGQDEYASLAALPVDNPADTIFEVIREHAENGGGLLTVQQAADMVKTAWEEDLARYKSNPKFLELLGAAAAEAKVEVKAGSKAKTLGAKTQTAARGPRKESSAYDEPNLVELARELDISWGA